MLVPKRKESVPVDEIMDLAAKFHAASILMERDAEAGDARTRAAIADRAGWMRTTAGSFRSLCYVEDADGKPVYEEWEPDGEADTAGATGEG